MKKYLRSIQVKAKNKNAFEKQTKTWRALRSLRGPEVIMIYGRVVE